MFTRFARTTLFTSLSVAAASAMSLAAAPASAQSDVEVRSTTVRYSDLDLSSRSGATELDRRVRSAVRSVCGVYRAQNAQDAAKAKSCSKVAMADAMPRVELAVAQARTKQGYAANDIEVRSAR